MSSLISYFSPIFWETKGLMVWQWYKIPKTKFSLHCFLIIITQSSSWTTTRMKTQLTQHLHLSVISLFFSLQVKTCASNNCHNTRIITCRHIWRWYSLILKQPPSHLNTINISQTQTETHTHLPSLLTFLLLSCYSGDKDWKYHWSHGGQSAANWTKAKIETWLTWSTAGASESATG